MCRMVGFISSGLVKTTPYVQALKYQAEHGILGPQRAGWGFCVYTEDGCSVKKSIKVAFEDDYTGPQAALTALFHARGTDPSTVVTVPNAHPFVFQNNGKFWSFVHNGTISKIPVAWGKEMDSKVYANLIEEQMKQGFSPAEALRSAIQMIQDQADHTSINALLATDDELLVVRPCLAKVTLFYHSSPTLFEVSTEPLAIPWEEVPVGTMFDVHRVADGLSVQTIPLQIC